MRIVAGSLKNRHIQTPKGVATRPTAERLREALFNICQMYIENASFLDLFSGSGAMGIEALSRGAVHATFIDNNKESIRCIQDNLRLLELTQKALVQYGNVFSQLERLAQQGKQYDIIYADPPYDTRINVSGKPMLYSEYVLQIVDTHPLLAPEGYLFIEDASDIALTQEGLQTLTFISSRRMGKAMLHQYRKVVA